MIYEIRNEQLTAKISSLGAELISVVNNKTNIEFIWQGDEKYWKNHAPVLFPQCGRVFNRKYLYKGQEYEMDLHGFVRHMEYALEKKDDESVYFSLESNDKTLTYYPFKFKFIVGYRLRNNTLVCSFEVINTDNKDMFFAYGGHPGFNCPIGGLGKFEDYYIEFERTNYVQRTFTNNGLYDFKDIKWKLDDNKIQLKHNLFDNDAIFFVDDNDTVTLKNCINNNYVKLAFKNMKVVGLWHTNKSDAPFICIEPWRGFPGIEGVIGDIETKLEETKLREGEKHTNSYEIEFYVE